MSTDDRSTQTAIEQSVTWRPLSEWKRNPRLAEAMFAFPCQPDPRYWSASVICDPDVWVDGLSDDERASGLWALVPYPYPQPVASEQSDTAPEPTIKSGWRFWVWVAILLPGALYLWVKDVASGR